MGQDIRICQKTRDIRLIDRTEMVAGRIMDQTVRLKEHSAIPEETESSVNMYAADKVESAERVVVGEGGHHAFKSGKWAARHAKEKYRNRRKNDNIEGMCERPEEPLNIRMGERIENRIKQPEQLVKGVKTGSKNMVKISRETVRGTERNSNLIVNTGKESMQTVQKSMAIATQTRKKMVAASKAKAAAKSAEAGARVTAKAVAETVKGMIASSKALISYLVAGGWVTVLILVIVVLFGGVLCMTGGDNSSTVSPVSAEVQAYEPVIRQYANQYGIPEYVELIKAVMMQESGGRGLDPMQSSEGGFNTRYPRQPNGITDPDYSISCGVQELKAVLVSAEVESPIDMEHIKLGLQGYNFGNGYISWARSNYGGYTVANAIEFSDMKAAELGWSNYGDKQYVPHVLRYYAFGRIPTGIGSQAIVQVALSQEGNVGGEPYWRWYGFDSRVEWCACFVSWCAEQCGYIESGVIPKFSLCSAGIDWFEERGQFRDASYVPASGDLIFFDWGNNGTIDHVGIVENVTRGTVNTIEGNSGDKCARRSYTVGSSSIYGYGVPRY